MSDDIKKLSSNELFHEFMLENGKALQYYSVNKDEAARYNERAKRLGAEIIYRLSWYDDFVKITKNKTLQS